MKKLLMILATMIAMTNPVLARFDDPIVLNEVRGGQIFICRTLPFAIEEVIDEIKAVKDNFTPAQYWDLLKPMLESGNCATVAVEYRPIEVLCKWTGASYLNEDTPLAIKTMRLFSIEVIVPEIGVVRKTSNFNVLYMITDKEGPDPIKNACEKIN